MKKFLLYTIYTIAVSAFFIYWLFPSDQVKEYLVLKIRKANPDMSVTIDKIKPHFPPGLKLKKVRFSHKDRPTIDAEWLNLTPKLLTLFKPEKVISFKGATCEGMITGELIIKSDKETSVITEMTMNSDLTGVHIKDIHWIQQPDEYKFSGLLNGKIIYTRKAADEMIHAKLKATGGNIEILSEKVFSRMGIFASVFKKGTYPFTSIDADVEIKNKKRIQMKECVLKGSQLTGNISGTIELKIPRDRSVLNLKGSIKPHANFLAGLGKSASMFFNKKSGEEGFPFSIRGTFGRPRPLLR